MTVRRLLIAVLLLPALTPAAPGGDGPAVASAAERGRELERLERQVPPWPAPGPAADEWCNLRFYLHKARYLSRFYPPVESVHGLIDAELVKAGVALAAVRTGSPPATNHAVWAGLREEAYYSVNDGSFQPFIRYLPRRPAAERPPLIVYLHGYAPTLDIVNWSLLPDALLGMAETNGFAVAAPFGRSNTDFQGIGEQDVMTVIAEMERRHRTDPERVVLVGYSMGGMGAWTIAAHYPHRFAGLVVISGRGDYYKWRKVRRDDLPVYKRRLVDTDFGFPLRRNLAGLPAFCIHAREDSLVPVTESRHMVEAVRRVNPGIVYLEIEDEDHWIADMALARRDVWEWMTARRRRTPESFAYVTYHPKYDRAYWLRLEGVRPGTDPAGVSVTVRKREVLVAADGCDAVRVLWNEMPAGIRELPLRPAGGFDLIADRAPAPDAWRPPVRGPVKEAFLGPFVFVDAGAVPGSPAFLARVREWYRFAKALPRTVTEAAAGDDLLASYHLFVFGEPDRSRLAGRILAGSPVRVEAGRYVVGNRSYAREGNGLYVVRPNPWNPEKLAVVQCGTPWGPALPENHKYDFIPDYIVYGDTADEDGSNSALAAGFFDGAWRLASELRYERPEVGRSEKKRDPAASPGLDQPDTE